MKKFFMTIRIILQFISFILLRIIYEPLNRILVDKFGCGCKEGFNCNTINNFVVFILFALTVVISLLNIKMFTNRKTGIYLAITSTLINLCLFPLIWMSLMWKWLVVIFYNRVKLDYKMKLNFREKQGNNSTRLSSLRRIYIENRKRCFWKI